MKTTCPSLFKISFIIALFLSANVIEAQTKDDCLICHSDEDMTYERNNKEVSLFVNEDSYNHSVHADIECVDCHIDFNAEELPHREGKDIYKVDCSNCHDTEAFQSSIHAKKKLHVILAIPNMKFNQPQLLIKT